MALRRDHHEGPAAKLAAPGAAVSKLVDRAASAKGEVVDQAASAKGKVVDQAASAKGKVVDKVASVGRDGVAQTERAGRELGKAVSPPKFELKEISPKRLLKRAIVAAALATLRRHLGVVSAAAGTLVLIGAGGYFAGRRSRGNG